MAQAATRGAHRITHIGAMATTGTARTVRAIALVFDNGVGLDLKQRLIAPLPPHAAIGKHKVAVAARKRRAIGILAVLATFMGKARVGMRRSCGGSCVRRGRRATAHIGIGAVLGEIRTRRWALVTIAARRHRWRSFAIMTREAFAMSRGIGPQRKRCGVNDVTLPTWGRLRVCEVIHLHVLIALPAKHRISTRCGGGRRRASALRRMTAQTECLRTRPARRCTRQRSWPRRHKICCMALGA